MQKNILLCGVGGQGIVLSSKLLAAAAMAQGLPVMSAETIGMAQKGGSVFSFLRIGEAACPMFAPGQADLLLAFEPAEAVRMLPYLKKDGQAVVNTHPIMPTTATLQGGGYDLDAFLDYLRANTGKLTLVDGKQACEKVGSPRALNMILLGQAAQVGAVPFSTDELETVMCATVKPQFQEINRLALHYKA